MVNLIPEEMLQKLLCSVCGKYLSLGPIKVYSNRTVKCGRCVKENDGGVGSLYNYIVQNCLFPCINKFEGCIDVLTINDVGSHEKMCKSGTYHCPYNTDEFTGSAFEIMLHFQKSHPDCFLVKPEICIKSNDDRLNHYLLRQNNFLILITSRFDFKNFRFTLGCLLFGENKSTTEIIKNIKIFNTTDVLAQYVSRDLKLNECNEIEMQLSEETLSLSEIMVYTIKFELDIINVEITSTKLKRKEIQTEKNVTTVTNEHSKLPKIKFQGVSDNFIISDCETKILERIHQDVVISTRCFNCNQYLIKDTVYGCSDFKHLVCGSCKRRNVNCVDEKPHNYYPKISEMFLQLTFECKWNCGAYIKFTDIEVHERLCSKSPVMYCPVEECNFCGTLGSIEKHFNVEHSKFSLQFEDYISQFLNFKIKRYIILNDFVIIFTYKKEENGNLYYHVNKCFRLNNKNNLPNYFLFVNDEYVSDDTFIISKGMSYYKIIINENDNRNRVEIRMFLSYV